MKNPNKCEIYAGLSGLQLPVDEFNFGYGVKIKKTYAHIMAPYLATFKPAKVGQPHPAPWKAVSGGISFDITSELYIPLDFKFENWFDRLNTAWFFLALLRLKGFLLANMPVLVSEPFSSIPDTKNEPFFWPLEMENRRLLPEINHKTIIDTDVLEWIKTYWVSTGHLMNKSQNFNTAFQAADQCIWNRSIALSLITVWGGLERLFSPGHQELRYRISSSIASYLEPPGEKRLELYKRIKKLYDARSRAAHGSLVNDQKELIDSYSILKGVLLRMIESCKVPNIEELESLIFVNQA